MSQRLPIGHVCGAYCRDGVHAHLAYGNHPDADSICDAARYQLIDDWELIDCRPVHELPVLTAEQSTARVIAALEPSTLPLLTRLCADQFRYPWLLTFRAVPK